MWGEDTSVHRVKKEQVWAGQRTTIAHTSTSECPCMLCARRNLVVLVGLCCKPTSQRCCSGATLESMMNYLSLDYHQHFLVVFALDSQLWWRWFAMCCALCSPQFQIFFISAANLALWHFKFSLQLHGMRDASVILARALLARLYDQKHWLKVIWQV